jgi:hypothetical protein
VFSVNAAGITASAISLQASGTASTSLVRVVQSSASATLPSVLLNNTTPSFSVQGIQLNGSGITAESTGTTPLTVPLVDAEGYIRLPVVSSPSGPTPANGAAYVDNFGLRIRAGGAWCAGNVDNVTLTKNAGITLKVNGITPRKQAGTAFFVPVSDGSQTANTTFATINFTGTSGRYAMVGLCSTDGGAGRIARSGVASNTTATVTATFTVNGSNWSTTVPVTLIASGTADFAASSFMRIVPVIAGSNTIDFKINPTTTFTGVQAYAILL